MKGLGFRVKGLGKIIKIDVLLFFIIPYTLCSIPYTLSYAETLSSKELIANAKSLNGRTVTYKGEAVTAILKRGEHSWINLNDGDNAIGVWCKSEFTDSVKFIGNYKNKGDILEVEGTFNRDCSLHGGELDIHANTVHIVKRGYPTKEITDEARLNASMVIFLTVLLLALIFKRRL